MANGKLGYESNGEESATRRSQNSRRRKVRIRNFLQYDSEHSGNKFESRRSRVKETFKVCLAAGFVSALCLGLSSLMSGTHVSPNPVTSPTIPATSKGPQPNAQPAKSSVANYPSPQRSTVHTVSAGPPASSVAPSPSHSESAPSPSIKAPFSPLPQSPTQSPTASDEPTTSPSATLPVQPPTTPPASLIPYPTPTASPTGLVSVIGDLSRALNSVSRFVNGL